MNRPVRRVALAVMIMVVALLANVTYVQVVMAGQYRDDPRNQRTQIDEYSRQRGQITGGGQVLAQSVESEGRLRYQRQYPNGPAFAPVTGFLSTVYGSGGLERSADEVLNGTDDRLFVRRLSDLITGREPAGGNVVTTIDPQVQQVAYDRMNSQDFTGAVVALEPRTGDILGMVSTPSYDPNPLAAPDAGAQQDAWREYNNAEPSPLVNRAISEIEPPGSTFKLVTTAAALQNGFTPDSRLTAAPDLTLADSTTTLENYNGSTCGGGATASLREALARSCNTAFAQLGQEVGADKLRAQAEAFGIGRTDLQIPMPVTASQVGPMEDTPSTQQSAIGQRDVRLTPMQLAMIGASIANGGQTMAPHLIQEIQGATLDTVDTTEPDRMARSMPADVAGTLTDLMLGSEERTQGGGKITGVRIASKTGTAEHGTDPKNTPPHAWYVAFAPAEDPKVAVAVLVQNGGNRALEATGGSVAAPIGRAVIGEALRDAQ
ncbi:peptidoglycan D,D-transpeptidase FtsI family protein [Pseudonocardia nantongensis]|uniref:peptidoglycan D,D-transpeptidase FtsI family protein n=1 Tax=Pseudonocardia nantongensis TaxID=1181885 RepID=UPI0039784C49